MAAADPLVRPEYGPSLAALLEARLGVPRRATIGVGLALAAIAAVVLAVTALGGAQRYVHGTPPVFNLRYSTSALRQAPTPPGWALVLDSHRGGLFVQSFAVRALRLPPHAGGASGYLPIYADAYERALARRLPGFTAVDEGKARINTAPGYQVTYQARRNGRTIFGRDVLLVPEDVPGARQGVVLRLLQTHAAGVHTAEDVGNLGAIKKPYRSFRFGTGV